MAVMQRYLLVALGGALGSVARYWVGSIVAGRFGTRFPYGTFVINISACFIIGFSLEYLGQHLELTPAWRYLIPIGFVGAYSTFSTFEWEILSNLQLGAFFVAGLYVALSVILGLVGVWCGFVLARVIS
jgi:CrcB protein